MEFHECEEGDAKFTQSLIMYEARNIDALFNLQHKFSKDVVMY